MPANQSHPSPDENRLSWAVWAYCVAIFLGAWLIFQVQPLMSKLILPWFGGTPQVWTICLLFFQSLLFAGYTLAYCFARGLGLRGQVVLYVGLLILASVLLSIQPGAESAPGPAEDPTGQILWLLGIHVGLPYLLLSATGPLLQNWFGHEFPQSSPYRLYALSNAGSLLALLSYPFVIDWLFAAETQVLLWSLTYYAYVAATAVCGATLWWSGRTSGSRPAADVARQPVLMSTRVLWFVLAMIPTILLAAITNKISLDVGSVPFTWVVPLTLYLLSLIICFGSERLSSKGFWRPTSLLFLLVASGMMGVGEFNFSVTFLSVQFLVFLGTLFSISMVCHGELVRLKPEPSRLTEFYLILSGGGAVGGIFVGIIAPRLFLTYFELALGLLAYFGTLIIVCWRDPSSRLHSPSTKRWPWWLAAVYLLLIVVGFVGEMYREVSRSLMISRNFYGVSRVWMRDSSIPGESIAELVHGITSHGSQFAGENLAMQPTTYYGPQSGVGKAINALPEDRPRQIGVIGLGAGTLAAYGRPGDEFDFYEINPLVIRFAEDFFVYLSDTPATTEVIPGDARLSLARREPQKYDVLVLDAFTSDAIPIHLLTEEAIQLYLDHLADDGILAIHISSRYFDLYPVLAGHADRFDLGLRLVQSKGDPQRELFASRWALLFKNPEVMQQSQFTALPVVTPPRTIHWTDAHSSLFSVLDTNTFGTFSEGGSYW